MGMFTELGDIAETAITAATSNMSDALINGLSPVISLACSLSFIYLGYQTLTGGNFSLNILMNKFYRYILIAAVASTSASITSIVIPIIKDIEPFLISAVSGQDATSSYASMDQSLVDLINGYNRIIVAMPRVGWTEFPIGDIISTFFISITMLLTGIILLTFGAIVLITSKAMFLIILPMAPLFILLLCFENTKGFFDKWVGMLLTLIFTVFFISLVINITFSAFNQQVTLVEQYVKPGAANSAFIPLVKMIFLAAISCYIIKKVGDVAGSLAGGLNTAFNRGTAKPLADAAVGGGAMVGSVAGGGARLVGAGAQSVGAATGINGALSGAWNKSGGAAMASGIRQMSNIARGTASQRGSSLASNTITKVKS